jgi:hypothetical protein
MALHARHGAWSVAHQVGSLGLVGRRPDVLAGNPGPVSVTLQTVENLAPGKPLAMFSGMRLRYLRRKHTRYRSYVWPPAWGGPYGLGSVGEGLLTEVRRIGNRLSLTVRFKGHDYVALLDEWTPPPTVDQAEQALTRAIGWTIEAVGEVDVSGKLDAPPAAEDKLGF